MVGNHEDLYDVYGLYMVCICLFSPIKNHYEPLKTAAVPLVVAPGSRRQSAYPRPSSDFPAVRKMKWLCHSSRGTVAVPKLWRYSSNLRLLDVVNASEVMGTFEYLTLGHQKDATNMLLVIPG